MCMAFLITVGYHDRAPDGMRISKISPSLAITASQNIPFHTHGPGLTMEKSRTAMGHYSHDSEQNLEQNK
jgi:hypothetical protein